MAQGDDDDLYVTESLRDLIDRRRGDLGGLTIQQLADRAGIPDRTLRAWRKGENKPNPALLHALGRALGGRIATGTDGTYRFMASATMEDVDRIGVGSDDTSSSRGEIFIHVDPVRWKALSQLDREIAITEAKAVILKVMRDSERSERADGRQEPPADS